MTRKSRKRRRSRSIPWVPVLVVGGIVLLLALVAVDRGRAPASLVTPGSQAAAEETFPEIPRVELDDARAAHDSGQVVFVDVRAADSYAASHIPGSLSIPLSEIEIRLDELDPSAWIITYCT